MLPLQSSGVNGSEFDAPEADRFAADGDTSLSQQIFNMAVTQIEAIVQPDSIGNYIWRESVAFIYLQTLGLLM